MITITTQEIAQYRSELAEYEAALTALDAIEDCEGDVEDAAISLAIKVGQQPGVSDWLASLAKRYRVVICQYQADLLNGKFAGLVGHLITENVCPDVLAAPIVIYAVKLGIEDFCAPLGYKLNGTK